MHANKREEITECGRGDIAAVVGLRSASTGDTICDPKAPVLLESMELPRAGHPPGHRAQDQGRPGEAWPTALAKLVQEDPTFRVQTDPDTGQTLIAGMGELHLEILVDRLLREFSVAANVGKPQVAYRETIRAAAAAEGRYIRQTGGRGQYGHVKIRIAPAGADEGFVFENAIVGGSIPRGVHAGGARTGSARPWRAASWPATPCATSTVELVRRLVPRGRLVGDGVQDRRLDGLQGGLRARPGLVLLEPVMKVEVVVPEDYMGDVIGDLNSRRGRIQSMESRPGVQVIHGDRCRWRSCSATPPTCARITQGRGNYTMQFSHYEEVPKAIAEEVVARVVGNAGASADDARRYLQRWPRRSSIARSRT